MDSQFYLYPHGHLLDAIAETLGLHREQNENDDSLALRCREAMRRATNATV